MLCICRTTAILKRISNSIFRYMYIHLFNHIAAILIHYILVSLVHNSILPEFVSFLFAEPVKVNFTSFYRIDVLPI